MRSLDVLANSSAINLFLMIGERMGIPIMYRVLVLGISLPLLSEFQSGLLWATSAIQTKEAVAFIVANVPWKVVGKEALDAINRLGKANEKTTEVAIQNINPDVKIQLATAVVVTKVAETQHAWYGSITVKKEASWDVIYSVKMADLKVSVNPKNRLIKIKIPQLEVSGVTRNQSNDTVEYSTIRKFFGSDTRTALQKRVDDESIAAGKKEATFKALTLRPSLLQNFKEEGQKLINQAVGNSDYILEVE